jgi:hypothetical protein
MYYVHFELRRPRFFNIKKWEAEYERLDGIWNFAWQNRIYNAGTHSPTYSFFAINMTAMLGWRASVLDFDLDTWARDVFDNPAEHGIIIPEPAVAAA